MSPARHESMATTDTFPIPMRGNELVVVTDEAILIGVAFPIPMRGNEKELRELLADMSIPMRGNEPESC